ncbi:MAG: ribonuclease III [Pyrinomonadaceae bacterium]
MPNAHSKLEMVLNYEFEDPKLLERALTHRSWANEKLKNGDADESRHLQNERLEFVGDSVLGLAVAEELYKKNPDLREGDLTLMKHHLVSSETLAKFARIMDLGGYMRIGRGEEKTGGREKQAILADTLEAVIGAIFFDTGYHSARRFIIELLSSEFEKVTPKSSLDYKTLLQETLQGQKREAPKYEVVKTSGPPHNRKFTVKACWDNGTATGSGNTIKGAEMEAASIALDQIEGEVKKLREVI